MLLAHNVLKDSNTEDDQSSMEQVENAKGDCLEKGHKGQLNLLVLLHTTTIMPKAG